MRRARALRRGTVRPTSRGWDIPGGDGEITMDSPTAMAMDLLELEVSATGGTADISLMVDGTPVATTGITTETTVVALDDIVSAGSSITMEVTNSSGLTGISASLRWRL